MHFFGCKVQLSYKYNGEATAWRFRRLAQLAYGAWRRWLLLAILAVSVLLRVGVAIHLGDAIEETRGGTYDQVSYDMLARRVAEGHGFTFPADWWPYVRAEEPTAFWSYLYTLYLAGVYALVGHHPLVARVVQAVAVGLLMPWLLFRIGRRTFDRRVGLLGAGIAAVYLYFVHYGASLMTEAFYITGILWSLDAAQRLAGEVGDAAGRARTARFEPRLRLGLELGAAMGITLLLRGVIVPFWGVLVLWLLWVAWRAGWVRRMWLPLLTAGAVSLLLISPWVVRNYRIFGRLAMPNTNAGFAFFWANHPVYGTHFEAVLSPEHGVSYQELIPEELRDLDEASLDRALLQRGLGFVFDEPGRYLLLSLSRIPVYFLFWPTAQSTLLSNVSRVLSFGLFLPFMACGLFLVVARAFRRGSRGAAGSEAPPRGLPFAFVVLLLLFVGVYTLIHLASWANVRYRLPVDAVLVLFAGYALVDLMDRVPRIGARHDA